MKFETIIQKFEVYIGELLQLLSKFKLYLNNQINSLSNYFLSFNPQTNHQNIEPDERENKESQKNYFNMRSTSLIGTIPSEKICNSHQGCETSKVDS